jgi:autotransporter-associated beta strand protein
VNSGGTLISTNDVILEYSGTGRGKLALNGGSFIVGPTAAKWLMIGFYDTGSGELAITNGNLYIENGSSVKMCRGGNTGTNVVNHVGGNVTFFSDAGVTVGGGGNLDLNFAGGVSSVSIYNLNGGTLTVPQIIASSSSGSGTLNFNGGTLKPTASTTTFVQGLTAANVRNIGVTIDTAGFSVTIGQLLQHSAISGDSVIDGGLKKNGNGILTLGATNTYKGNTAVNVGTLALASTGSITNSRNIAVAGGALFDVSAVAGGFTLGGAQTLSGGGTINGAVSNNGTISPGSGVGTIGTLTFNNSPVLNGINSLEVSRNSGVLTNDQIKLPASGLTYGGTLTVSSIGEPLKSGDTFQLFSATSYAGVFTVTNFPALDSGLAWSNSLAVNGSIAVIATVSKAPTNIVYSLSGDILTLSWPTDHTGWRLQVQTNSLNAGFATNWFDVPESGLTNNMALPVDATQGSIFYRLIYP